MAELIGVVSSAITIAQVAHHVGPKILALRKLWDEVKDVPEAINRQMTHLEMVFLVLDNMENEVLQSCEAIRDDPAAKHCLVFCRQAVEELESLIRQLENQISSAKGRWRTVAKYRVVLKKHLIEDCQHKLGYAIHLVTMSQQMHFHALLRLQPAVIVSELKAITMAEAAAVARSDGQIERESQAEPFHQNDRSLHKEGPRRDTSNSLLKVSGFRKTGFLGGLYYRTTEFVGGETGELAMSRWQEHRFRLCLSTWLIKRAWDLQVHKSFGRWQCVLTTWNVRDWFSEIFQLAYEGRADELMDALVTKQASLYDCTPDGGTLLDAAASGVQIDMMKLLMRMGLSRHQPDQMADYPAIVAARLSRSSADLAEFFHMWLKDGLLEPTGENGGAGIDNGHSPKCNRLSVLHVVSWWYWRDPAIIQMLEEKAIPGLNLSNTVPGFGDIWWTFMDPEATLQHIQHTGVTPATFRPQLDQSHDSSTVSLVSAYLSSLIFHTENVERVENWRKLIRWTFDGARPDEVSYFKVINGYEEDCTPLVIGLYRQYMRSGQNGLPYNPHRFERAIVMWLEDLVAAGVDLQQYGEIEQSRYPGWAILEEYAVDFFPGYDALYWFTYGPRPEDWRFFWGSKVEEFAGEFWKLVEPRAISIPGAWADENEDEDEGAYLI